MKKAAFITVRMKSTRLPKKALLKIKGRTTIEHLIDRVKSAKKPDIVVLCTSTHPDDAVLADVAKNNGIEAFRGSPDDKLDRYLQAAKKYGVEFIANVDGDDILCDPELIDRTIEHYEKTGVDCIVWKGVPLGGAPTGIKVKALEEVCKIKDETDTEVWGGYFLDTGLFKVECLEPDGPKHPEFRLTLDYPEDLEFFKAVIKKLWIPGKVIPSKEIISFLEKNPRIVAMNKHAQEKYLKTLKEHTKVKIKKK